MRGKGCVPFLLVCVCLSIRLLPAQVREEWVARYDAAYEDDTAHAIAVDAEGYVYVTGSSRGLDGDAAATIKYDRDGRQLWVARYHPLTLGQHVGFHIALDGKGNVYVAGNSQDGSPRSRYLTIKYDRDGRQVWSDHYRESPDSDGSARALAVDGEGNVYVTGVMGDYRPMKDYGDYVTIKYDTDGNRVWVARYDGPQHGRGGAGALALDGEGNVYVTGGSRGEGGWFDYATIKYDRDGREVWVARFHDLPNENASARSIALDAEGNVYVTGNSGNQGSHYVTIKYDGEGQEVWVARYYGNRGAIAHAMALGGDGSVYVTGQSLGEGTDSDYATVRYNTDGQELWVAHSSGLGYGYNQPRAIAVDGNDNVYVTGWSEVDRTRYDFDYITVKYDPQGQEVWVARYDGPRHEQDYAYAIALDKDGNVYVTGASCGLLGFSCSDYATIKYSQK